MSYFKDINIKDIAVALKSIINLLQRPMWLNPATGSVRLVDGVTTVSTVSAITTLNIVGISSYESLVTAPLKGAWALNIRNRIT